MVHIPVVKVEIQWLIGRDIPLGQKFSLIKTSQIPRLCFHGLHALLHHLPVDLIALLCITVRCIILCPAIAVIPAVPATDLFHSQIQVSRCGQSPGMLHSGSHLIHFIDSLIAQEWQCQRQHQWNQQASVPFWEYPYRADHAICHHQDQCVLTQQSSQCKSCHNAHQWSRFSIFDISDQHPCGKQGTEYPGNLSVDPAGIKDRCHTAARKQCPHGHHRKSAGNFLQNAVNAIDTRHVQKYEHYLDHMIIRLSKNPEQHLFHGRRSQLMSIQTAIMIRSQRPIVTLYKIYGRTNNRCLICTRHSVYRQNPAQSCDSLPKHAERYGNSFTPDGDFVTGLFFHCRQNCIQ